MITKSSGFTLIELLVVVAILGILSSIGIVSYQGYISGTRQKSIENAMQQISLAQTEEYSNSGEYHISTTCGDPSETSSDDIETELFGGGDIITKESGYNICVVAVDSSYLVKAADGNKCEAVDGIEIPKIITMTANGIWTGKEKCELAP